MVMAPNAKLRCAVTPLGCQANPLSSEPTRVVFVLVY